jgi:phosphatidate phosphatase APP1
MGRLGSLARHVVLRAASTGRTVRGRAHLAFGGPGPMEIVTYRGYGCATGLPVRGRVLADEGLRPAREDDRLWRNVRNMRKRVLPRPISGATVAISFQDRTLRATTDAVGYFEAWVRPAGPLAPGRIWHEVALELEAPLDREQGPVRATAEVRVPGPRARFVIISDMDDTVIRTGAASVLSLLRESFTGNAYTRVAFPGVAALYRALRAGASGVEENPLLFVSRSPWNLHDLFEQFLDIHGVDERAVLFLRRWGLVEEGLTRAAAIRHKHDAIAQLMSLHPALPVLLVGDSGQQDPEIYREIVRSHPGRVLAVYVRNVSRDGARQAAVRALAREVALQGATLILASDSLEMARHAARHGWIDPVAVSAVAGDRAADSEETNAPLDVRPARRIEGADEEETAAAIDRGALDRELDLAAREHAPVVVEPERREHGGGHVEPPA